MLRGFAKGLALAGILAAVLLAGCGKSALPEEGNNTGAGVTIENIKVENYFDMGINREHFVKVPERVLVVGANEIELLLDLDTADAILAAADGQNHAEYGFKERNRPYFEKLPKISRQSIVTEHVLSLQPDLIVAEQQFFSKNYLGSTDHWNARGIHTMVPVNTTSPGKVNREETLTREMQFIRDMGAVFQKEERAERIIRDTYARIDKVREAVKDEPAPRVMILDRMSILASYGRKKIAGDMAASLGAEVPDTPAAVSFERLIELDPDVIFLVVYRDEEKELSFLSDHPALQGMKCIKEHRIYGIPLKYVYGPQTRTIDALGYMAERMYPGKFHFPKEYAVPEE